MDLALNVFSMKCYLDYYYLEIYKLRNISFYIISQKLAQSTHLNYKTAQLSCKSNTYITKPVMYVLNLQCMCF